MEEIEPWQVWAVWRGHFNCLMKGKVRCLSSLWKGKEDQIRSHTWSERLLPRWPTRHQEVSLPNCNGLVLSSSLQLQSWVANRCCWNIDRAVGEKISLLFIDTKMARSPYICKTKLFQCAPNWLVWVLCWFDTTNGSHWSGSSAKSCEVQCSM